MANARPTVGFPPRMSVSTEPVASGGAAPEPSLRETTARGFLWTTGQALFNRGLSLVGFVVLARLLTPHAYGLAALANVFIALLAIVAAGGYSRALVQRPDVDGLDFDTIFWIGLATSAV